MKKNCRQCLEEFEAKRSTATFCSDKCRKNNKRGVSATAGMTPDQIRDYKKKEMELNIDNLPVIDAVTGEIMEDDATSNLPAYYETGPTGNTITFERSSQVDDENLVAGLSPGGEGWGDKIQGQEVIMETMDEGPVCIIPTKEQYDQAVIDIEEYESHFPIANKEHAKTLAITSTQCHCTHCGEPYGSMQGRCPLYCKYCKSADQRKKVSKARNAVLIIQKYKDHHKEFDMYECPICNVKI